MKRKFYDIFLYTIYAIFLFLYYIWGMFGNWLTKLGDK